MRLFGKGKCSPSRHVWDRDPNNQNDGTIFMRVDCVRCGYKMDATKAKLLFERLDNGPIPGRVATPEQVRECREKRVSA